MVGRSNSFRHISVCVDPVVMTFRGIVESFIAVLAFVRLFPGTVGRSENSRYSKGRAQVKDQMRSHVLKGLVRLQRPLARETPLAELTDVVSGK